MWIEQHVPRGLFRMANPIPHGGASDGPLLPSERCHVGRTYLPPSFKTREVFGSSADGALPSRTEAPAQPGNSGHAEHVNSTGLRRSQAQKGRGSAIVLAPLVPKAPFGAS